MRNKFTSKNVTWGLAVLSFLESSFFPIIIDPFLIAAVALHRERWIWFAVIATFSSVAGATFAYFVGMYAWSAWGDAILAWTDGAAAFAEVAALLDKGAFLFTMIGAVTPVPYKLTSLAGGVFHINFGTFLIASVIGRFARFLLVAYLATVGRSVAVKVLPYVTWRRTFIFGAVCGVALVYFIR